MIPCSSGNSPTMPVARSALASRAASARELRIGPDQRRDLARQRLDPLHPLVHGPELGVEGDALQLLQPVLQRNLAVLVPEEAGVVQPRRQHPGVARGHGRAAVLRLDVGDRHEARREARPCARVAHGEVLLVGAHGGADHLRRQVEEGRVHLAQHRDRPFGQARHLVEQALVLAPARGRVSTVMACDPLQDARLALLRRRARRRLRRAFAGNRRNSRRETARPGP